MATTGRIAWKKIKKMLDKCTESWHFKDKVHKRWVYADGIDTSYKLPQGSHGSKNPEIEIGHIRGLVRHFDIGDCAKKHLEQLR